MLCQGLDALPLGDRGAPGHAGDNQALAQARESVFRVQACRRRAETRDARRHVIFDPALIQRRHLFPDRPVEAGVPGMQADGHKALRLALLHGGEHLLKRHFGAVQDAAVRPAAGKQRGVYEAAGIDDLVGPLQQRCAAQGDEIRRAGSGADEMYHEDPPRKQKWRAPKGTPKSGRDFTSGSACFRFRQKQRPSPMYLTDPCPGRASQ